MAGDKVRDKTDGTTADKRRRTGGVGMTTVRNRIAQVVWILCVIAALLLAVGALFIALNANQENGLVSFVLDGANVVDLGVFSMDDGIKDFGANEETKNALFNWGLGAIFWLVLGRILDRIIRP